MSYSTVSLEFWIKMGLLLHCPRIFRKLSIQYIMSLCVRNYGIMDWMIHLCHFFKLTLRTGRKELFLIILNHMWNVYVPVCCKILCWDHYYLYYTPVISLRLPNVVHINIDFNHVKNFAECRNLHLNPN